MDKDLENYYVARLEMFQTRAWQELIEDLMIIKSKVADVESCSNLDFAKGQLKEINYILTLQDITEQAYEELLNAPV